jgi:rhodanese-related sulfurtransferase
VNIPFTHVLLRPRDTPGLADEEVFLYCGHGPRAYLAAAALGNRGRARIVYLRGHFAGWLRSGLKVER